MLPFTIKLQLGQPIHKQVVFAVHRALISGELMEGDRFPSVKSLSKALGINPNTAHKIISTLITDGLLVVQPGIGTVVTQPNRHDEQARATFINETLEHIVVEAARLNINPAELNAALANHWRVLDASTDKSITKTRTRS